MCIVRLSFDEVKNLDGLINDKIKIIQITHYSNRASLTLNINDKKEIIWPLKLRLINKSKYRSTNPKTGVFIKKI